MKTLSDEIKDQIFKQVSVALIERRFDDVFEIGRKHITHENEEDQNSMIKNFILYIQNAYWPVPLSVAIGGVMRLGRNLPIDVPEKLYIAGQAFIDKDEEQLRRCILGLPLRAKEVKQDEPAMGISRFMPKLRRGM